MRHRSWSLFLDQTQKDARLWLLCIAAFGVIRAALITLFRGEMAAETGAAEVAVAFLSGARFDSRVAVFVVFPAMLLSLLCLLTGRFGRLADRARIALALVFLTLTAVVGRIDIGYFREFRSQFDHFALGVLFDDMGAIMDTVRAEYSLWRVALGLVVLIGAGSALARWWLRRPFVDGERLASYTRHPLARAGAGVMILLAFVVASRGSLGRRPAQGRDAAISPDPFLNKVMLDPYTSLRYAWQAHLELGGRRGVESFLPDGDVRTAAYLLAAHAGPVNDLPDALLHVARGQRGVPSRHIFVVIIESFDSWPMLDEFASLHLADRVKALARQGIWVRSFLPGSVGSMASFDIIVSGLADAGLITDMQPSSRVPYETSLPGIFRRLGYRTRMFYSGFESRHRIGDFSREQGFDEVYCGGTIGGWMKGNEWGVNDADLFRFVLQTVDDERPSFNVILTSSNHPPYDVDVYGLGFHIKEPPPEYAERFAQADVDLNKLGHHWYSDRSAGEFVERLMPRLPRALVAITGDHWSRRFIDGHPTLYARSSVPLVLYGPEVLAGVPVPERLAGSHLDIGPTLIELAAPAGFRYHALGRDILDPRTQPLGFGRGGIIGPDFILALNPDARFDPIPGVPLPAVLPDRDRLLRLANAIHGVSWWRIRNGPDLPLLAHGRDGGPAAGAAARPGIAPHRDTRIH